MDLQDKRRMTSPSKTSDHPCTFDNPHQSSRQQRRDLRHKQRETYKNHRQVRETSASTVSCISKKCDSQSKSDLWMALHSKAWQNATVVGVGVGVGVGVVVIIQRVISIKSVLSTLWKNFGLSRTERDWPCVPHAEKLRLRTR